MTITKNQNGANLTFALEGRLDTTTAPALEEEVKQIPADVTDVVMDFAKLEYISSAGLRVLLSAQKLMNTKGSLVFKNVCEDIMEVFDITGFSDILTIEQ